MTRMKKVKDNLLLAFLGLVAGAGFHAATQAVPAYAGQIQCNHACSDHGESMSCDETTRDKDCEMVSLTQCEARSSESCGS